MAVMNEAQSLLSYAAVISTDGNFYGSAFTSIIASMATKKDSQNRSYLQGTWDWTMYLQKFENRKWVTKATKTGYLSATSSSSRSFTRTDTGNGAGTFRIYVELVQRGSVSGSKQKATLATRSFVVRKA